MPTPLTNAAERGTIEIEKESLPVRRLARFIYYLEKVADSLAGRLLFHAFEQFHHQCNDDSEYHQHNGEQLKITHEVTLPSTRLPTGGYVNRKFRLPGKGQPPENSLQAVLPVDCASSLLVPFLGRLSHGIPCTSRIADISMDCNILAAECLRCQFAPMAARFARAHRTTGARARPSAWAVNSRLGQLVSLVHIERIAHVRAGGVLSPQATERATPKKQRTPPFCGGVLFCWAGERRVPQK